MDSLYRPTLVESMADIPDTGRVRGAKLNGELIFGNGCRAGPEVEPTLKAFNI